MKKVINLIILFALCQMTAQAQCLVSSLVINTGYDPITGLAITGSTEGGTPVPDPKWVVTAETPSIATGVTTAPITLIEVVPGNSADVVGLNLDAYSATLDGWATFPTSSWISCVNSDFYETDGTGPSGTVYEMTLSRCFRMCSADSIVFDLYIAGDNFVSSFGIDGVLTSFSEAAADYDPNEGEFAHYTITVGLSAGSHCMEFVLGNYNKPGMAPNPCGMNIHGTVSSLTGLGTIIGESDTSCASYVCSSTIPCVTTALNISTGYDPVAGALVTPTVLDPKWTSTVSPATADSVVADAGILGCYDIVPLPPPYWSLSGSGCNWISSQNTTSYNTDGSGADIYWMTLTRPFNTCVSDSLILNMNIESDDWISEIDFDGSPVYLPGTTPCGSTSFSSYVYHLGMVAAGAHSISIVVHNCNNGYYENSTGMALYGTVNSASGTASITTENNPSGPTCSCLIGTCNTLTLADSAYACDSTTIALAGTVTGPDSIISIHWSPATGLSDTGILDPALTVGTTSGYYYLTVESLLPGNLVYNGDFEHGDTAFTSAYPYVSGPGSLVPEGVFAITTDPHLDHSGAASFGDHTTGTGNMMAVNGASAPIDVWCQTIVVTPNTYYDFSAWFANWSSDTSDNLPVIQFEINGVPMVGSFSFPHPDGVWTQYANSWYSGSDTTATICIHDSVTASGGNDFAIDDISFQQLCIATDSVYVHVYQTPNAHLGDDTTICSGSAVEIKPVTIAVGDSYTWSTGAVTDSISVSTTGNYWVTVGNHGCLASDTMHLLVNSAAVNLGADTTICAGQSDVLQSLITYTSPTYTWSTGATTPTISESAAGTYWLTVSQLGCTGSDTVKLFVSPLPHVNLGNDTILCNGSATTLRPTTGVGETYTWSTGATTSTISATAAGAYWVKVDSNNCYSSDTMNIQAYTTIVNLGADTSICQGQSVDLQSTGTYTSPVYLWSTGATTPVINVNASGNYWLTVSQSGCTGADTVDVTVNPIPVVDLGPDTAVCSGVPVYLQSLISYVDATYLWSTGSTTPTLEVTVSGVYALSVTIAGCTGTDVIDVGSKNGTLVLLNVDTAICRGVSIQALASDTVTATFQWRPTAGIPFPNIADPIITPDTSATYIVTATVAGCPPLTDSFHIDVQPNPIAVFIGGNRMVCHDDTLHINAVVNPGWYTHYSYNWSPATYIDDPASPDIVFANGDTTTLIVTVTTPAGCIGMDSAQILVHANDFLKTVNPNGICPGDSAQLIVTSTELGTTAHWYPPIYLSDSLSLTPWIYPITSQGYSVVGVSQYGCLDTLSIGVTVYPAAILNVPDSITLYPGESYQMEPVTNCTTLSWFPELGLSNAHITNPVAMPDVNTMYIIHGSTEEGCTVVDSIHVIVDPTTLLAVPNAFTPGNGPNNVIKVIKRGIATLNYFRIYNRWGNMVYETNNINDGWDGTYKGVRQPQDVFVYEVQAVTNTGRVFTQKGNITLLR